MDSKKISFIVPVYNNENTLCRCIDSIIEQDYKNIEIIIINDGSTDNSSNILSNYTTSFDNIVVIHQDNKGPGAARNVGICHSKGEYISFVDSDDAIKPSFCSSLLPIIQEADIAVGGRSTYVNGKYTRSKRAPAVFYDTQLGSLRHMLIAQYNAHPAWGKLYKSSVVRENKVRFPENVIFEDIYFALDAYLASKKVGFSDKDLYQYFIRDGSITTSNPNRYVLHLTEAMKYIYKRLNECKIFEELVYEYKITLSRTLINYNLFFVENSVTDIEFYKEHIDYLVRLIYDLGGLEQNLSYKI